MLALTARICFSNSHFIFSAPEKNVNTAFSSHFLNFISFQVCNSYFGFIYCWKVCLPSRWPGKKTIAANGVEESVHDDEVLGDSVKDHAFTVGIAFPKGSKGGGEAEVAPYERKRPGRI